MSSVSFNIALDPLLYQCTSGRSNTCGQYLITPGSENTSNSSSRSPRVISRKIKRLVSITVRGDRFTLNSFTLASNNAIVQRWLERRGAISISVSFCQISIDDRSLSALQLPNSGSSSPMVAGSTTICLAVGAIAVLNCSC